MFQLVSYTKITNALIPVMVSDWGTTYYQIGKENLNEQIGKKNGLRLINQ